MNSHIKFCKQDHVHVNSCFVGEGVAEQKPAYRRIEIYYPESDPRSKSNPVTIAPFPKGARVELVESDGSRFTISAVKRLV